jgi:hypothetical protein
MAKNQDSRNLLSVRRKIGNAEKGFHFDAHFFTVNEMRCKISKKIYIYKTGTYPELRRRRAAA